MNIVDAYNIMETSTMVVIFAIVAALGLVGAIAVETLLIMQEVDAAGCRTSIAVNASKGRCFKG
jgi:hypothetical protein